MIGRNRAGKRSVVTAFCGIASEKFSLLVRMRLAREAIVLILIFSACCTATFAQSPVSVSSFDIVGAEHLSSEELTSLVRTRTGRVYDEQVLEDDIERLLARYSEKGYAFAEIRPSGLRRTDSSHIAVTLRVREGRIAHLVRVVATGILETDSDVVAREFLIRSSPPLSRELLDAGVLRLRQSGLFTTVSEPQLFRVNDSSVGITLSLQEARTTNIDGVLGYAPNPASGTSAYINGFLDLAFRNIGGTARSARLRYERLTPNTSDLAAAYTEPWLAAWPVDAQLTLGRHDEDSLFVATHAELSATLHSIASVSIAGTASYDGITPGRSEIVRESHTVSGGITFSIDDRDDRYAPHTGYAILLGATFGSKSATDTLGYTTIAAIRSLAGSAEAVVPIGGAPLVGVVRATAREVTSDALDLSDLYRLGGINSLRGYREASFVASRYVIATIEPRFMMSSRSYFGAFVDIGGLEQVAYEDIAGRKWSAVGYGISMLFDTQIGYVQGAIALARGVPLDAAVLHLGLRTAF